MFFDMCYWLMNMNKEKVRAPMGFLAPIQFKSVIAS